MMGILAAVRRRFEDRALILLYHRVARLRPDPQLLCVSPENFAAHMEHVRKAYEPVSLRELVRALAAGSVPDRAVAVTFDDGYADNLWNAGPVIEKYGIPATVFVAADFIGGGRESLSEELEGLLLEGRPLPDPLDVVIGGRRYSWPTDGAADGAEGREVTMDASSGPRQICYKELHRLMRPLDAGSRAGVLDSIAAASSRIRSARPERRSLTPDELIELARTGLVDIGSHGAAHLVLAAQTPETQRDDIFRGKKRVEEILKDPLPDFAYPYGGPDDIDRRTVETVKEAGFESACTTVCAPVRNGTDPFRLPRLLIRDWDGREFAERLKSVFDS